MNDRPVRMRKIFFNMGWDDPFLWEKWERYAWGRESLCRIELNYREWMRSNWHVFALFLKQAKRAYAVYKPFSIALLAEGVRWESFIGIQTDVEGYRLNNNYKAFMSRDLIKAMPDLVNVLVCREQRHDEQCRCALSSELYKED